jgi:hypothetical protein
VTSLVICAAALDIDSVVFMLHEPFLGVRLLCWAIISHKMLVDTSGLDHGDAGVR